MTLKIKFIGKALEKRELEIADLANYHKNVGKMGRFFNYIEHPFRTNEIVRNGYHKLGLTGDKRNDALTILQSNYKKTPEFENAKKELETSKSLIKTQSSQIDGMNILLSEIDDIFKTIRHDLRPQMEAHLELALELLNTGKNEDRKNALDLIVGAKRQSEALLNTHSAVSEWSSLALGGNTISEFEVGKIAQDAITVAIARKKDVKITLKIEPEGLKMVSNKGRVEAALRNLVDNAMKFTNNGGRIDVAIIERGGQALFTVKDTGIGMPKEKQITLFNGKVFSSKGTNGEQGTGMGLMNVKSFVNKCGGSIWFESVEGQGSAFYFEIPLQPLPK